MMSLNIHPLFVFDGPNKPPFKRNKRTGPNVASIPEFLAKQLLKHFGYPMHNAPGEAEAECALLQREGVVDAVLSEDVDTLMFGSKLTIRNWTAENKGKTPTHVNLYDSEKTKTGSGLDREGMILVALMSGGDYVPQGIPGCGPKIACEAAKAGFGHDLCKLRKKERAGFVAWRERLSHELRTNESKFFRSKHVALKIPEDFPNTDILGYYTHPAVSTLEKVQELKNSLSWERDLDFAELRSFTGDAFDWRNFSGAKKFVRNLAQSLLVRELTLGQRSKRSDLVKGIHALRTHSSTDGVRELRISYTAIEVVNIDLSAEPPDDEFQVQQLDAEEADVEADEQLEPLTQGAKSRPYLYDPTQPEKIWIPEAFVRVGDPTGFEEWEKRLSKRATQLTSKAAAPKNTRGYKTKAKALDRSISKGALESFVQTSKSNSHQLREGSTPCSPKSPKSTQQRPFRASQTLSFRLPPPRPSTPPTESISLLSSSPVLVQPDAQNVTASETHDWLDLPSSIATKRRKRSPLRRTQTHASDMSLTGFLAEVIDENAADLPGLTIDTREENTPKRTRGAAKADRRNDPAISTALQSDILSSPSKSSIVFYFSPKSRNKAAVPKQSPGTINVVTCLDLTMSSPCRGIMRSGRQKHADSQLDLLENTTQTDEDVNPQLAVEERPPAAPIEAALNEEPQNAKSIESIDLTMSSPLRSMNSRRATDTIIPSFFTKIQSTNVVQLDLSGNAVRNSPRLSKNKRLLSKPPPTTSNVSASNARAPLSLTNRTKQWVRIRKSVAGTFDVEDHESPQSHKKGQGMWKMCDIKVLDLS
jgi:holliday junction resolvase GEN1/YEN1